MGKLNFGGTGIQLVQAVPGAPRRPIFPGIDDDTPNNLTNPHPIWGYGTIADLYVDDANGNDSWNGTVAAFTSGSTGPKKTIAGAVSAAVPGNKIAVRGGHYRLTSTISPGSSKVLSFFPYNNEVVIVDGAAVIAGAWTTLAGSGLAGITVYRAVFSSAMRPHTSTSMIAAPGSNGTNYPTDPNSKYAMIVMVNGVCLTGVGSIALVGVNNFFHDYTNGFIYIGQSPAGKTVEGQVIRRAFDISAANSSMQGFVIMRAGGEYADTGGNDGAVRISGNNCVFKNNTVAFTPSFGIVVGISGGTFQDVTDNFFYHCGVMAICGQGGATVALSGTTLKRNVIWKTNKIFGHRIDWATGGVKLLSGTDMYMFDNYVYDSNGAGLWFDYSVYRSACIGNFCEKIAFAGLDSEMSRLITFASNIVVNAYYGILCQGSHDDIYAHNMLIDCLDAYRIINDNRTISGDADGITGNTGTLINIANIIGVTGRGISVNAGTQARSFYNTDDFETSGTVAASTWFSNSLANLDYNVYFRPTWVAFTGSDKEVYWENGSSITQYTKIADFITATVFEDNSLYFAKSILGALQDFDGRYFEPVPGLISNGPTLSATLRGLIGATAGTGASRRGPQRYPGRTVYTNKTVRNGWWDLWIRANSATSPGTSGSGDAITEASGNGGIDANEGYFPDDVNQNLIAMAAANTAVGTDGVMEQIAAGDITSGTNFRIAAHVFNRIDATNYNYCYLNNGLFRVSKVDAGTFGSVATVDPMLFGIAITNGKYYHIRIVKVSGNMHYFYLEGILILTLTFSGVNTKFNVGGGTGDRLVRGGTPTVPARIEAQKAWAA